MKDRVICQNCGGQALREYDTCPYGIAEEHIKCECGYWFDFAYGYYLEKYPGNPAMTWSHLDHEKKPAPEYDEREGLKDEIM